MIDFPQGHYFYFRKRLRNQKYKLCFFYKIEYETILVAGILAFKLQLQTASSTVAYLTLLNKQHSPIFVQ